MAVPASLIGWMLQQGIPINLGALLLSLRPLVGLFATAMLLVAVAQRRNWARLALLAISGYGLLVTALDVVLEFRRLPALVSIDIVVSIATVYALALLFGRESNAWFRRTFPVDEPSAGV